LAKADTGDAPRRYIGPRGIQACLPTFHRRHNHRTAARKAQVTRVAEPMLAPGGFFASHTSTLSISSLV
jgi:hypothetical protein